MQRIQEAIVRLVVHAALALPPALAHRVGRGLGLIAYRFARSRRRVAQTNIARAYDLAPEDPKVGALVRENFIHYGVLTLELLRFPRFARTPLERTMEFRGFEHLDQARAKGKGVLLLTAHIGNYDYLASAVAMRGYPLSVVIKPLRNKTVGRIWLDARERTGLRLKYNRGSMRDLLRSLRRNEFVGIILDQHARGRDRVWVEFFGRPAGTFRSAAVLAARTGAPVVPIFTRRLPDGRHLAEVLPPVELAHGEDTDANVVTDTQAFTDVVEAAVRGAPAQWTWVHKRWKEDRRPQPVNREAGGGIPDSVPA